MTSVKALRCGTVTSRIVTFLSTAPCAWPSTPVLGLVAASSRMQSLFLLPPRRASGRLYVTRSAMTCEEVKWPIMASMPPPAATILIATSIRCRCSEVPKIQAGPGKPRSGSSSAPADCFTMTCRSSPEFAKRRERQTGAHRTWPQALAPRPNRAEAHSAHCTVSRCPAATANLVGAPPN